MSAPGAREQSTASTNSAFTPASTKAINPITRWGVRLARRLKRALSISSWFDGETIVLGPEAVVSNAHIEECVRDMKEYEPGRQEDPVHGLVAIDVADMPWPSRQFPGPWFATALDDIHFAVMDAQGMALMRVRCHNEQDRRIFRENVEDAGRVVSKLGRGPFVKGTVQPLNGAADPVGHADTSTDLT